MSRVALENDEFAKQVVDGMASLGMIKDKQQFIDVYTEIFDDYQKEKNTLRAVVEDCRTLKKLQWSNEDIMEFVKRCGYQSSQAIDNKRNVPIYTILCDKNHYTLFDA